MVTEQRHNEAMDIVRALVNTRERCVHEVKLRLIKAQFSNEEIDDAIDTSLRCNIISNERYASAYIRGKTHLGWGKEKIILRLKQNGISDETIYKCESDFPSEDEEYSIAYSILSKKPSQSKNKFASYMNRLISKGYSFDLAKRVTQDFIAAQQ